MPDPVPSNQNAPVEAASREGKATKQPGIFLAAEWVNLVMLNYAIDPGLLHRYVPAGTELDSFEGNTYISLIGFEFNRTRIGGIAVPFHGSFEEVNLRFYVKRGSRRGVVFIRELVPKRAVAAVARFAFGENYSCVPMGHTVRADSAGGPVAAEYFWSSGSSVCRMKIETAGPSFVPTEGSLSQFITEHYWGYAAQRDGSCIEYEVKHPQWRVRAGERASFSGDAARFYGHEFASILNRTPDSAFLAEGSVVTVFRGRRLK